jgi:hypothetical protein
MRPHFENLIIHLQFVLNLELRSSKFLLVFFVLQVGISLRGEVNRLETRLIIRGVVVLRLQGSVFRSEAGLVCHSLPKTIVTFYLTEDRESRSHQLAYRTRKHALSEQTTRKHGVAHASPSSAKTSHRCPQTISCHG